MVGDDDLGWLIGDTGAPLSPCLLGNSCIECRDKHLSIPDGFREGGISWENVTLENAAIIAGSRTVKYRKFHVKKGCRGGGLKKKFH